MLSQAGPGEGAELEAEVSLIRARYSEAERHRSFCRTTKTKRTFFLKLQAIGSFIFRWKPMEIDVQATATRIAGGGASKLAGPRRARQLFLENPNSGLCELSEFSDCFVFP